MAYNHTKDASPNIPMALSEPPVDEIRIRGRQYDISNFKKIHPGGNIIKFYLGQDATEAFNAFHARSTIAEKYLLTIPSRPAGASHQISSYQQTDPLVADFENLRKELYEEGYFDPSLWHVSYRILELIIILIIGVQLFINGWVATGIIIITIAEGRSAWIMHESGHYSFTGNVTLDRIITVIFSNGGLGLSASFWRNQHSKHHAMPQKLKHDVDLNTLPLIAYNSEIAKHGPKIWLRWQAFTFCPLVIFLTAMLFKFFLHPRYAWRRHQKFEFFCFALRYVLFFGFLFRGYTVWQKIALYSANVCITSSYLFVNFALNHTHTPVVGATEHLDWVRFAAYHTVDVEHAPWCNWWMGYLNYQIEHHLFPTMPQYRQPEIAHRVRALFNKHGVPYRVPSYWEALKMAFSNLNSVGKGVQ